MQIRGNGRRLRRRSVVGSALLERAAIAAIRAANGSCWYLSPTLSDGFAYVFSTGVSPVTAVADAIGFLAERSYSQSGVLGPNLYTGGDIMGLPIGGSTFNNYPTGLSSSSGKTYEITATVTDYAGSGTYSVSGVTGSDWVTLNPTSGNGVWRSVLIAINASAIAFFTRSTNTANFRNISIRELYGCHAVQGTTANKPAVAQLPTGKKSVLFDSSTDSLAFYMPSTALSVRIYTTAGTLTTVTSSTSSQFVLGQPLLAGRNVVLIVARPSGSWSASDLDLINRLAVSMGATL